MHQAQLPCITNAFVENETGIVKEMDGNAKNTNWNERAMKKKSFSLCSIFFPRLITWCTHETLNVLEEEEKNRSMLLVLAAVFLSYLSYCLFADYDDYFVCFVRLLLLILSFFFIHIHFLHETKEHFEFERNSKKPHTQLCKIKNNKHNAAPKRGINANAK